MKLTGMLKEIEKELDEQLDARCLRFNVESLEDYRDQLELAAEYIEEAYEDIPAVEEKVNAWVEETLVNYPGHLLSLKKPKRRFVLEIGVRIWMTSWFADECKSSD